MALGTCKECGGRVSKKATQCPHCGAPGKRRTSGFTWVVTVFVLFGFMVYVTTAFNPPPSGSPQQPSAAQSGAAGSDQSGSGPTVFDMEDAIRVGYTAYEVRDAWYSDQLTESEMWNEPPNASYVFVRLSIRNEDDQARAIPPIHLVDGKGAEYDSRPTTGVDNSIGVLDSLNPGVTKTGVIVFDVPRGRRYQLLVSGGFWSSAEALIDLDIRASGP